jgi:Ca2+-binding RTX toxin-like protein
VTDQINAAAAELTIANLNNDTIRTWAGNGPINIDVGGNAEITGGSGAFSYLSISFYNALNPGDRLSFTGTQVQVDPTFSRGTDVLVNGIKIGVMAADANLQNLSINFNENATADLIEILLQTVAYSNTSTYQGLVHAAYLVIILADADPSVEISYTDTSITVAPQNQIVLTQAKDIINGTDGNDVFHAYWENVFYDDEINGGAGEADVLQIGDISRTQSYLYLSDMNTITGVEIIRGSASQDYVYIRNDQLAGIKSFEGGAGKDRLYIEGGDADLRGKTFTDYSSIRLMQRDSTLTVSSKEVAKIVIGGSGYDTLVVDGASLSAEERSVILRNGIDEIRITGPNGGTYRRPAPVIQGLDSDRVKMAPGQVVHVDAGRNAMLADNDTFVSFFAVHIANQAEPSDLLGIDTSGRFKIPDGIKEDGSILYDGQTIGTFTYGSVSSSNIRIDLNGNATLDIVNELARAVTYTNVSGRLNRSVKIEFTFGDSGSSYTTATVTVDPADPIKPEEPIKPVKPIIGGRGNDALKGGAEGDKIEGGRGADKLWGGKGADTFVFKSTKDSGVTAKTRDTIYDFSAAEGDKIDLKALDANTRKGGDQAFKFIAKQAFHKKAGELRFEKMSGGVLVQGDVNGDGKADFSIAVKGLSSLTKGYFTL